ncbi:hypothetical protein BLA24_31270 [Streptomyces cinnamoneus]|uniref:Uncharacterized protein n=1 Tax=Streptomyces cinnamoneus TaxID=53446 RepID=A0A2G1X9P6_STRCJ|nr:DUF6099 family protein [Streptomyces cinnamoneus]PHQ47946.1 hypothetical protein BLA24_31270 [Streptomyces cinnamoneus]PPT15570.1 hypothetical protein CYQ11_24310 [Streptomyces cinnamoneus]
MDAARLIEVTRHALARAGAVEDIVVEAWQAQALAEAVGSHLAAHGPFEVRAAARGLSEAGGRASGALCRIALRAGGLRAAQLGEVRDPWSALTDLGDLLGEVGIALVGVACACEEDAVYWQCIEAIDAADETSDRISGLLRRLTLRERGGAA